ncbi:MAG: ribosome-associated translation inhibitor RaiA [Deltaproteobacteria bacterium]|nr:ribosome-associated translation inhibitor RaiA [Deltaproteobacteria bacterium]
MNVTVTFRHTEPMESLRAYAEEKVAKTKKYFDAPLEAHIVLSVEKFRHIADVTLSVDGGRIKAVEETEDMYSAIDKVMDKIELQVKKRMSKIRDHRPEVQKGQDIPVEEEAEDTPSLPRDEPVIELETMEAKPMDPEEAAMQLNLLDQDFLVFRNAKSKEINVLYKKGDGNLGLIEPSN